MQEDRIREALVELLYRNSYGVVVANILISVAAAYVLRSAVSTSWLIGWLGALYLLTAIRVLAARRFFSRDKEPASALRWAWLAAAFSCVSGLLWGAPGWVGFLPQEPVLFSFTVIVLTGLICGTVPSLSAFPPALVGSIIATVLPITVRSITNGGDIAGAYLAAGCQGDGAFQNILELANVTGKCIGLERAQCVPAKNRRRDFHTSCQPA